MKLRIIIAILAIAISGNLFAQKKYTLDDCKKLTETRNFNLKNSELEILSAAQTSKEAYTKYFPEIKGSAFGFNNSRSVVSMDLGGIQINTLKSGVTGGITAIQPIYTGGNISNSNKLAKLGEEVSKYQREITKNDVLLETEKSFWLLASLMPRFIAAFWVLSRVRKLELKNTINSVLLRPSSTYLKRSFFISKANAKATFKSPMSCTPVNFFIVRLFYNFIIWVYAFLICPLPSINHL